MQQSLIRYNNASTERATYPDQLRWSQTEGRESDGLRRLRRLDHDNAALGYTGQRGNK